MRSHPLITSLAFLALALFAFPAFAADAAPDVPKLYKVNCSGCHGKDGKGQTKAGQKFGVPDFTSADWQTKHDEAKITKAISEGVEGTKMKSFAKRLTPEQVTLIAKHVKSFATPAAPAAPAAPEVPKK